MNDSTRAFVVAVFAILVLVPLISIISAALGGIVGYVVFMAYEWLGYSASNIAAIDAALIGSIFGLLSGGSAAASSD